MPGKIQGVTYDPSIMDEAVYKVKVGQLQARIDELEYALRKIRDLVYVGAIARDIAIEALGESAPDKVE